LLTSQETARSEILEKTSDGIAMSDFVAFDGDFCRNPPACATFGGRVKFYFFFGHSRQRLRVAMGGIDVERIAAEILEILLHLHFDIVPREVGAELVAIRPEFVGNRR